MKKSFKKFISVLLTVIICASCFAVSSFAAAERYTVLVLDCSGSMSGSPIAEVKEAATAFCNQVISSHRGANKVAIVSFESSAYLRCDFTNDLDALTAAINNLYATGGTNLAGGLEVGKNALSSVDDSAIKNMIVMCDGSPNSASAAYNVVRSVPMHWNIYGLYFSQDGYSSSAATVMKRVGRNGYQEVTDGSSLVFAFGDWGSDVTTKSVNNVVVRIACPVDVSVALNNETLNKNNTKTLFGELSFEGENNEIKVLNLAYRNDYVIDIIGTGDGTMDYSIDYRCNDEVLYSLSYPTVDITPETVIKTGVDIDNIDMKLSVDENGDGTVDEEISANASTSNIWYRIKTFLTDLYYAIVEFFMGLLG